MSLAFAANGRLRRRLVALEVRTVVDASTNLSVISEARQLVTAGAPGGAQLQGKFVDYACDLGIAVANHVLSDPRRARVSHELHSITGDIWNIGSLVHRLERTDNEGRDGKISADMWRSYCGLDIEHFFIELRAIGDHAARCISAISDKPGAVPGRSMRKLRQWIDENPGNVSRLGADLATAVSRHPSFPEVRAVRDGVVHDGALTLVFGKPGDGLLFQVQRGFDPIFTPPRSVMRSSGLVDFRRYGSILFAELLVFLESLGVALQLRLPVPHVGLSGARMTGPGVEVLSSWFDRWSELAA